jgi:hypothetical protein
MRSSGPAQDRLAGLVADRCHVERHQRRPQFGRAREIEAQARIVGNLGDRSHPGQRLGARLGLLGGRGAGTVAGDIVLEPGALRLLAGARRLELGEPLGELLLE